MKIGYYFFQCIFRIILFIYFRWEVNGLKNIPRKGGGLIACNHTSYLDPGIAGTAIPRPVYYLARQSLYRNKFARWFIHTCQGVPIRREGIDRKNIQHATRLIQKGELLVTFPEGTRSNDGTLQKGKPGIGALAWSTKALIIPCYIEGALHAFRKGMHFPRPKKIRVFYARAISLDSFYQKPASKELFQEITDEIMRHIALLKKDANQSRKLLRNDFKKQFFQEAQKKVK